MAVLIQSIESIEIHRQVRNQKQNLKRNEKTTTDILVNGARWAFQ